MTEELHAQGAVEEEEEEDFSELIGILQGRSATYGLLSRLYRAEVDQALLDEMHGMLYPADTHDENLDTGYLHIATYLSNLWDGSLKELKADYARCFLGHGVDGYSAAYPFESVYTSERRLLMEGARKDVLRIYRRNGVTRDESWKEGEDHVSLELDFERILGDRTAQALQEGRVEDARRLLGTQRDFLEEHLFGWTPMMTVDMKRFAQTKLYQGLAYLTDGFLGTDRVFLRDLLEDWDKAEQA